MREIEYAKEKERIEMNLLIDIMVIIASWIGALLDFILPKSKRMVR